MNPTLGLLLPLMLGQPAGPAPGCAPCLPTRLPLTAFAPPMPQFKQLCPPAGPPAPVLAVRAVLADGMTIVPVPTDPKAKTFASGTTFGFRPGYQYALRIDNLPERPGQSLYPVLEVRGSLVPRPGMKYMEYPASLTITRDDLEKAFQGRLVTKVIYLEDPSKAVPLEATPDKPVEVSSETVERALREAEDNGRLVAVLRFGDRDIAPDMLARMAIPGTVLLPDEALAPAAAAPYLGCSAVPLYDPILGPKSSDLECFINGGDVDMNLGIGRDGTVQPLRNTNTIAEFVAGGRKRFTASNIVCLCVPRFVIRRVDVGVGGYQGRVLPASLQQEIAGDVFRQRQWTQSHFGRERLLGLVAQVRASQAESLVGLHAFATRIKPVGLAKVVGLEQLFVVAELDEISNFPGRLVLTKQVEPKDAIKQGDVLTVTLRYYNNTKQSITDLVLTDSLSPRLELVAGSAAGDRPSNQTIAENEAGSQIIRFEIPGPVPPAGSGVVVFKVKVR